MNSKHLMGYDFKVYSKNYFKNVTVWRCMCSFRTKPVRNTVKHCTREASASGETFQNIVQNSYHFVETPRKHTIKKTMSKDGIHCLIPKILGNLLSGALYSNHRSTRVPCPVKRYLGILKYLFSFLLVLK